MKVEIIAELAQGFEGHPEQARLLLRAAAAAGADAVKYQLVFADELATPDYKHYNLFRSLEMADDVWTGLASYAAELGVELQFDVFGMRSLQLAERIGTRTVKLHGTDLANVGLLQSVASSGVARVLLGAGGAHDSEIRQALGILTEKDVVVLLGFQGYPTSTEDNQIARVRLFADRYCGDRSRVTIGFADHALPSGPLRHAISATAIGAGAIVLEKHLTLSKVMKFEDYEAALDPDEFAQFVSLMRACATAFGDATEGADFGMSESEKAYRRMIRRHVVTSRNLQAGQPIEATDLILKRTSVDAALTDMELAYRKIVRRDLRANEPVTSSDVE